MAMLLVGLDVAHEHSFVVLSAPLRTPKFAYSSGSCHGGSL